MLQLINELRKNCCGTGQDGKIEGSTRGPRGPKNNFCCCNNILLRMFEKDIFSGLNSQTPKIGVDSEVGHFRDQIFSGENLSYSF